MSLRVAVLGVGAMGANHARVYSDMPAVDLVGVADPDQTAVEAVARRYHTQPFVEPKSLLEEVTPQAVSIAAPTVEHLDLALECIDRGLHLLIEKPLAFSIEEGERIMRAADEAGLTLMVGHVERFNPAVVALKERLEAGELGRVFQLDARREGPFPNRVTDVGVVIDLAVHDLDVMRYITGSEVTRVFAETERRIHSQHEDLLAGLVRLADGSVGTLAINWLTPTKIREIYVTGERGMFQVDYLTQDLYFYENATARSPDWDAIQVMRGVSEGRMIRHVVNKIEPLRSELTAFVKAVQQGSTPPVTGDDGLRALALAHAIVASGETHQVVEP